MPANLISHAGLATPLPDSFVNINEFLPPSIFKLWNYVRSKVKEKGFLSFIRGGEIYVKKKKDDVPVLITAAEELESFLI